MATASCTACGGGPCCHDCCLLGCHDQHSRKLHNSVGVAGLAGLPLVLGELALQICTRMMHPSVRARVCTLYKSHAQCYFFIGDFYAASSWCSCACATVGARATLGAAAASISLTHSLLLRTISAIACPSPHLRCARLQCVVVSSFAIPAGLLQLFGRGAGFASSGVS